MAHQNHYWDHHSYFLFLFFISILYNEHVVNICFLLLQFNLMPSLALPVTDCCLAWLTVNVKALPGNWSNIRCQKCLLYIIIWTVCEKSWKKIMKKLEDFLEEKLYKGCISRPSLTNSFKNSTSVVVSQLTLKAKTKKPLFYFLLVWHMMIGWVKLFDNKWGNEQHWPHQHCFRSSISLKNLNG